MKDKPKNFDLFGNEIITDPLLREKFLEPPFSVLDTKTGSWQRRKKHWMSIGMKSEVGRDSVVINMDTTAKEKNTANYVSIFDPFAGGSVRGIVANYLGYEYTGVDIRPEQIDSNHEQAKTILGIEKSPKWIIGDTDEVLNEYKEPCDFVFSCPPYADLEVYSDLEGDISNMNYTEFLISYESIIKKSCALLRPGGYACFVVGEVRNKKGDYIGFVPDTIRAFQKAGMKYYNEAIY